MSTLTGKNTSNTGVSAMEATNINLAEERKYTCAELAKPNQMHADTIRKMFANEPGVIRIAHGPCAGGGKRRQYFSLRIPQSVAERVFRRLSVDGGLIA